VAAASGSFSEDFESYSTGAWTPESNGWTETLDFNNWEIVAAGAEAAMPTQHLKSTTHTTGDGMIVYDATSAAPFADGTISCEIMFATTGHTNNQPSIFGRYLDTINWVQARIALSNNKMHLLAKDNGVYSQADFPWTMVAGWRYKLELVMNGTTLTANLYNASDPTTVIHTGTMETTHLDAGGAGIMGVGQVPAYAHFDNFNVDTTAPVPIAPPATVFSEDFEAYTVAPPDWVPGDNNWTVEQTRANQGYKVLAAAAGFSSKHLYVYASGIDTSKVTILTPDLGPVASDGIFTCHYEVGQTTNYGTKFFQYARFIDMDNWIQIWGDPSGSTLNIVEKVGGVLGTTYSSGVFNSRNTDWFSEVTLNGTTVTFKLWNDEARTSLKGQVSATVAHTTAGKIGIGFYAGFTNDWLYVDDIEWAE